ncbi:MAG: family 43 glycosylhydrolase [Phycisphaerae bacterium]
MIALSIAGCASSHRGSVLDAWSPSHTPTTYCNPMNLNYSFSPVTGAIEQARHRATADPVIVPFAGDYYLFSTNQWGYWWSSDLIRWTFVPRKFIKPGVNNHDDLCAPAAWAMDGALHVIGSTVTPTFPIYASRTPKLDTWTEATPAFSLAAWDPSFFVDDDGRLYLYYGASNTKPVWGIEVDRKTLNPIGEPTVLMTLNEAEHGWERFGEHNDNTWFKPFLEGVWMNKHAGRYYLQYAAPGTEFSGYADGVYVSDKPLGPFEYQSHNPFAYKPGGFARGAGHGATFQDFNGHWWHTGTVAIGVKNNFERRIALWPAMIDGDGLLHCDTAYGDFPHRIARSATHKLGSTFTGWMILNYNKPVRASSTLGRYAPNFAVDEDIKTYWCAATSNAGEWFESDLGAVCTVRAIQINHADQDATFIGHIPGLRHRYRLLCSDDARTWRVLVDKSDNQTDVPHDYIELATPVETRFIRLANLEVPSGKFALSGLRVFGNGHGSPPPPVEYFSAFRGKSEPRNAWLKWKHNDAATGYVIYAGASPDKLYTSVMALGANDFWFRAMERDQPHYFAIEAFNENGISPRSEIVKTTPTDS